MFKPEPECPICSTQDSVEVLTNVSKEYLNSDGKSFRVDGLVSLHCKVCGETYINTQADKLNAPKILDAKRSSEGLLPSTEICRILDKVKEKSHLPESQIERILGIGERSLPRWKTRVAQSAMADAILLMLDRDPDAILYLAECRGIELTPSKGRGRPRREMKA
jgi:YgiT-type zinc finger domain-containing protein